MSSFQIAPIAVEDIEYVATVMQQRWNVSRDYALNDTQCYLRNDKEYAGFCVHHEGKTVGVGLFSIDNEDVSTAYAPWVYLLWVEPEFRGHGLGIELTKRRVEHARAFGYKAIYLDTVDAEPYHKMLGWEEIGRITRQGKETILMKYDLSKPFPLISPSSAPRA